MNLLAIDSSCSVLSIAVCRGNEIRCEETEAGRKHSDLIMNMIDSQLKSVSLKPGELDGVLCMGGPGSFTGLRIAYSIAKGLALSLSIPIFPVPTMDCIAFSHSQNRLLLTVIESGKNSFYYAFFKNGRRLTLDSDAETGQIAAEIGKFVTAENEKPVMTGPGAASLYEALPQEARENQHLHGAVRGYSKELISIAKSKKLLDNDSTVFLFSGPEYIRKTDAEMKLI